MIKLVDADEKCHFVIYAANINTYFKLFGMFSKIKFQSR